MWRTSGGSNRESFLIGFHLLGTLCSVPASSWRPFFLCHHLLFPSTEPLYLVFISFSTPKEAVPFLSRAKTSLAREEVHCEIGSSRVRFTTCKQRFQANPCASLSLSFHIYRKEIMAFLLLTSPVSAVAYYLPNEWNLYSLGSGKTNTKQYYN